MLVIDTQFASVGEFIYVNIAGDGQLLTVDLDGKVKTVAQRTDNGGRKAEVLPLPIIDSTPEIVRGKMQRGESLLLVTDGIGDHITTRTLQDHLAEKLAAPVLSHRDLIDLCMFSLPDAGDDRSLALVQIT